MKRLVKWFAIGIGGIVAIAILFVLSGYLLPAEQVLDVEQSLSARPEALFALFTTYEGVDDWWRQAALDMGDDLEVTHLGGPTRGVDLEVGFRAPGKPVFERWHYTSVEPPHRVEMDVDFQIFMSHRVLELTPEGTGTKVRWRETARIDSPIWRWMLTLSGQSAVENRRTVLIAAGTAAER